MKKYRSLELAIAFFMCTIAFYFGGIYFNFNFQNHFSPLITTVNTQSENLPKAELTYADLSAEKKVVDVLFFYYSEDNSNPDKNPSLGTNDALLPNIKSALGSFTQYIRTASNNSYEVEFNIVSTAINEYDETGEPLILEVEKPATINKQSVFSSVMTTLQTFTGSGDSTNYVNIALSKELNNSGNDIMLVYLDYKSYLGMEYDDAQARYNENTSGVFSLDYSKNTADQTTYYSKASYLGAIPGQNIIGHGTAIQNFFLIHSDALTSTLITENAQPNFYNKIVTKNTKMLLNLLGLPNLSYVESGRENTTYAGNHSILSNGTYFATFNPYYAYLLGKEKNPSTGWLSDTFSITQILKEGDIEFDSSGNQVYYISPEGFEGQSIVLYYVNTNQYNQWTFEEGQSTPPTDGYVVVARINTKKNLDGSYASATSTFAPFYVFEPSNTNGALQDRSSTLENARLANVGDVIGFMELGTGGAVTSPHTGFVSLEKNVSGSITYINTTLKFTVKEKNGGIKIKVECNNSDIILPENVAIEQPLHQVQNLSPDVAIYLYNDFISRKGQEILDDENYLIENGINIPSEITTSTDMIYTNQEATSEDTWNDFYNDSQNLWRQKIYNLITTHDFSQLTTLDFYGLRDITSLKFLQEINFNAVQKLCLTGTDLSQGYKTKDESSLSLEYLAVLENLEVLEMNSCQIQDLAFLRNLGSTASHSKLRQLSVMNNNITDLTPINGEYLSSIAYVNVHNNQISNESLQSKYRSTSTNFYNSTAIDIGLQRMPYEQFITQKGKFIFKAWTTSSFTNIITSTSNNPLVFSSTFTTSDSSARTIYSHDPNGTSLEGEIILGGIKLYDLAHGKFELKVVQYLSLMSKDFSINAITRTLPSEILNCYYMEFEYEEEELCQTPSTEEYLTGLGSYDNLNPLLNYNENHFSTYGYSIRMDKVTGNLVEQVSSIDISQAGDYEITYTFQFNDELVTNLFGLPSNYVLGDIIAKKKLKVWEYKKIEFQASATPLANKIIDPILYKSLLFLTGRFEGKLDTIVAVNDSKLGIENEYTLYNQDFYFYGVANKHIPSILEKRLNTENEAQKGVLTSLDISSTAQEIIRKKLNISKNGELPENIIASISGIQFMNLLSIEEINLNALGIDSINEILTDELLPRIKVLNAGGNKITSITDIQRLRTLEYLDLSFNLISDPTPLQELTDPSKLKYKGFTTQILKKVNISFNQISIKGNKRMNSSGISEFASGNNRNTFLIDASEPENSDGTSFIPQNQIYIVLVQMLSNFDHYGNTSKFEYYYTPALKAGNGELYTVKYGRNNASPSIATSNFSNSKGHTEFSTDPGNYSINSTLSTDLANRNSIPFKAFSKTYYYTVSKASVNSLEKTYGSKFPSNLLLNGNSTQSGTIITYTMLTTEYQEFLNNLMADLSEEDKASFHFGAKSNDVALMTSSAFWAYNAISGAGINFFDEDFRGEPIRIETSTDDNSANPNVNNLNIQLRYTISFYRTDTRTKNDPYAELASGEHVDRIVIFLNIKLIYNPAISLADENLKEVLLLKLNKPSEITDIYAYDFYNIEELDLSNADIKTFDIEVGKQDEQVSGFEDLIFNNLTRINLSNNLIENTASTDSTDPLFRLLGNPTIFPTNLAVDHKIQYLDLSYNKLTSLVPLEAKLFKRPITLNLFGNNIDFYENNAQNLAIISSGNFANGAITPCKVFIGLQGLGASSLQKLVSFKKNILSSEDTYAKFTVFNGNFYIGVNDISYSFDGAEVEYRDSNGQIVLSKSDSLYTIYYYKDTYYRENQNYSVYYNFAYEDYINIELNTTIIHQKMYFDIITNEFGEEIEKDSVYKEFHNDYDLDAFNAYNQQILDEDIFVYENGSSADFNLPSQLFDSFDNNLNGILYSNKLTGDHPYTQYYDVTHKDSGIPYRFPKIIHIVDSTAPQIQTSSPDSKMKYVVLKGSTYAPYYANKIDKDLVFVDDYDNYYFKELVNPLIKVTISKDGEVISEVEANWNDTKSGLSINCNNPGRYEIKYVAVDSNGNESEPFVRIVEVYYQPYSYIKLSDFSAIFSAGTTKMTASVYKTEEDVNRNTNPTFYWYVDGKYVGTSFANAELSGNSSISTSIEVYIEGAGTHTVQVFIDMTKESYDENVALGIAGTLSSATKSTSVFILMDNTVLTNTLIGVGIVILLIIILIIIIVVIKRKRESRRNEYSYTIIKHDK